MHRNIGIIIAAHVISAQATAQVQCPRCKGPNGNSCHCEPAGAIVGWTLPNRSTTAADDRSRHFWERLERERREWDDHVARMDALREQSRREWDAQQQQWRRDSEARRASSRVDFSSFYPPQRDRQDSLIGTYSDHIGGIVTSDMFGRDTYEDDFGWQGSDWPRVEYRDDWNQRLLQQQADLRVQEAQREAERLQMLEQRRRVAFEGRRDREAAALKSLLGDAASGGMPMTRTSSALATLAGANSGSAVSNPQARSVLAQLAVASQQQGAADTVKRLVTPSLPSASDVIRGILNNMNVFADDTEFGDVGEKLDSALTDARDWLSSIVRDRAITSENAGETARVLGTDAALEHLRAIVTRDGDSVEASADKKANIIDWVRQSMEQQSKPPQ
jgi:hypothetical protein